MNTEKLDSSMPPLRILKTKRLSFLGDAVYDGGTLVAYDTAAYLVEWREMPQQHLQAFQTSMRRFARLLSHVDTSVATVRCKGLLNVIQTETSALGLRTSSLLSLMEAAQLRPGNKVFTRP